MRDRTEYDREYRLALFEKNFDLFDLLKPAPEFFMEKRFSFAGIRAWGGIAENLSLKRYQLKKLNFTVEPKYLFPVVDVIKLFLEEI